MMNHGKKRKRKITSQHLPVGCRSFMTFEDESLKEGEVMLQIKPHQSHVTMRGVKAESLDIINRIIRESSRDYDLKYDTPHVTRKEYTSIPVGSYTGSSV
jgi:hypothetical protein